MIFTTDKSFANEYFENEADFEAAILELAPTLFGTNRIFLPIKKLIGKGKTKNIPDGYLIDLSSRREPRLFVIEVELESHHPLKHIAVQVLEFSLSFETSPQKVKTVLRTALDGDKSARSQCEAYAKANGFENLDYLLERIIQAKDAFAALVIIDDLDAELAKVLGSRFTFPVEILTLRRFKSADGQRAYQFEPFLNDVTEDPTAGAIEAGNAQSDIDPGDIDTIVVPAREDGFKEVFLGENRWYHIRIHPSMVSKIQYAAVYQVAPISAITYVAPVASAQFRPEYGKYVLHFAEPAKQIGPIKLIPGANHTRAPQAPRYTSYARLMKATNLDEAF